MLLFIVYYILISIGVTVWISVLAEKLNFEVLIIGFMWPLLIVFKIWDEIGYQIEQRKLRREDRSKHNRR